VDANRSTNGIDCSHTIPTTIARAFLWIGSCFLRAVSVDVIPRSPDSEQLINIHLINVIETSYCR